VVTIPVVVLLALLGVWGASQVRSDFSFTDFLASDTDAVQSLDKQEFHYGDLGVGTGYIYVEGDLTRPSTLEAMEAALDEVTGAGIDLSRDFEGEVETVDNAITIARFAVESSVAGGDIAAATGVEITDGDGNGLPDDPAQVAAIYGFAAQNALRDDDGQEVFTPDQVRRILYVGADRQATRLEVVIGSFTDGPLIDETRTALEGAADGLRAATAGAGVDRIGVSGESVTLRNTLDAFTRSMLLSLPLALLLTFLIVALVLKSVKYSLVSVAPILLVVAWVYGFMYLADYTINPVTATIAAISIGVGIDFATHFTVRFREELAGEPSRFPALRRAGEGTGGALLLSALTSIGGFAVLGMAPMPIFAMYGVLTAVMIALAVLVSLLVLPSLLLFATPSLKGEERERLEWERTRGEWVYDPHARETATQ
jgi:predicted RND superfamily exporter protein